MNGFTLPLTLVGALLCQTAGALARPPDLPSNPQGRPRLRGSRTQPRVQQNLPLAASALSSTPAHIDQGGQR